MKDHLRTNPYTPSTQSLIRRALWLFFVLSLLPVSLSVRAMFLHIETVPQHGAVMARSMVKIDGEPILVGYNDKGQEVEQFNFEFPVEELLIFSRQEYQSQVDLLGDWKEEHKDGLAKDAEVMAREEFLGQSFTLADGHTTISPPALHEAVKSVVVRGQSQRYSENADDLVLLSFTVDLSGNVQDLDEGIRTVILDPDGRFLKASGYLIAPRTGYYGRLGDSRDYINDDPRDPREHDDEIFGPVHLAVVRNHWPGGATVSDDEGRYSFSFVLPPCPPGGFDFTADTFVELYYKNFNPNGAPAVPYYLRKQAWAHCPGILMPGLDLSGISAYLDSLAILAAAAEPIRQIDFYVDVMFLTGTMSLKNPDGTPVKVADKTEYELFNTEHHSESVAADWYDFDGDGIVDESVLGRKETKTFESTGYEIELFYPDADGEWQGVYLSSSPSPTLAPSEFDDAGPQPDFYRLADTAKKLESTGFLKTISKDDLQNTDLLLFRESTGELVMERRGLRDEEIDGREQIGEAEDEGSLFYRLMIRGPDDHRFNIGGGVDRRDTWGDWAEKYHLSEPFREQKANHLRAGEWVNLVVINRATGYMTNKRVQLSHARTSSEGLLNIRVEELVLQPPNLKVWAKRTYNIEHGSTAGEIRDYLIGAEGAGLTSDTLIEVYTEWLDHNGRPLPEGLGEAEGKDYGLTGRLAKVTGANEISETADGGQAQFPIAPGRQTQVIQLSDNLTSSEHYYIHVSGTQSAETPEFGNTQNGDLVGRPGLLTPFWTPLYDEQTDWETFRNYLQVRNDRIENQEPTDDLIKPDPYYAWLYRPEYQFSRYSLEAQEIQRDYIDVDDQFVSEYLLLDANPNHPPGISSTDELITFFYSLIEPTLDRLPPIDGPQELVLALGAEEVLLTVGTDRQVTFENLAHIEYLEPADLTSLRLYTNQDAGNVLWEFNYQQRGEIFLPLVLDEGRYPENSGMPANYSLVSQSSSSQTIQSHFEIPIKLEEDSLLEVEVLDYNKDSQGYLLPDQAVSAGTYHMAVLLEDLGECEPRAGIPDCYVRVRKLPLYGGLGGEILYEITNDQSISGQMLGQVIEHDVLIHNGALTLSRQDFELKSGGLPISFSRSYSNAPYTEYLQTENSLSKLGPGWRHNHDIYLNILAKREYGPSYRNELPGWIGQTRDDSGPLLIDTDTWSAIRATAVYPSRVSISNGGQFKRSDVANTWYPQLGYHGTLTNEDTIWEFTSKDGTVYRFETQSQDLSASNALHRIPVTQIIDRNGNTLDYEYGFVNGQKVLLSVTDNGNENRKLTFVYDTLVDSGSATQVKQSAQHWNKLRLMQVQAWDGVEVSFDYTSPDSEVLDAAKALGFDRLLESATRGIRTEGYDYEITLEGTNPFQRIPRLTQVTDANDSVKQYEYANLNLPAYLIAGAGLFQPVGKVHYPATTGNNVAKIDYEVTPSTSRRIVTDLNGNDKEYELNSVGNPTRVSYPENKTIAYTWSYDIAAPGNYMVRKEHVAMNAVWEYSYDTKGNLIEETDPLNQKLSQSWDPDFAVLLARTAKDGSTLAQTLDDNGNVITRTVSGHVNGEATTIETRNTYGAIGDYRGLLLESVNGREATTTYDYDGLGLLSSVSEPEGSDTGYKNDARGRRVSMINPNGNSTSYLYDNLDNLVRTADEAGNRSTYSYDAKGNKLSESRQESYRSATSNKQVGWSLQHTYDARDRIVTTKRSGTGIGGSKTYTYDGNSNLLSETDWNGVATEYSYDGLDRLVSTTDRLGKTSKRSYGFTSDGLQIVTTDRLGRVTTNNEDALGRLTQVEHPPVASVGGASNDYVREMTYDGADRLLTTRDENGGLTTTVYDDRGLVVSETDAENKTVNYQYDAAGNRVLLEDKEGRKTTFAFDKQNRLISKIEPENHSWSYTYFPNGNLQSETNPWGETYSYTYDKAGRRTSITHPDGTDQEGHTLAGELTFKDDAAGRTITRDFDGDGRLVRESGAAGRVTDYEYDENGNRVTETLTWAGAITGPGSVAQSYTYDNEDRLKTHTLPGGIGTVEYTYDDEGNRVKEERPEGRNTEWGYDELNRVIRIADAAGKQTLRTLDGLGNVLVETDRRSHSTTTTYDKMNRPKSISYADGTGRSFTYDAVGNTLSETNPRGFTLAWEYDGLNRVKTHTWAGTQQFTKVYDIGGARRNTTTDANGNTVDSTEDWRGNILTTKFEGGAGYGVATRSNSFDASGYQLTATDENGLMTQYTRFADGRLASVTNPATETTRFEYDIFGEQARITRPLGGTKTLTRDERGRLVSVTDALGQQTRFTYDANDNQLSHELPGAGSGPTRVSYGYNTLNRKIRHTQHLGGGSLVSTFAYDAEGNLISSTDPKNQSISYSYDELGRETSRTYSAGSDLSAINTSYDENGNVKTITENTSDGGRVTSHSYDDHDRLISQTQRGHTVTYAYDDNGNRTQVSSGGGSSTYQYDARNRLSQVTSNGESTDYTYYANGWLNTLNHANGTQANYRYDNAGRVTDIRHSLSGGRLLSSFAYTYDANGNRTRQEETQNGFVSGQNQVTQYVYDRLDRLESYTQTLGDGSSTEHLFSYYPSYDRETYRLTENGELLQNRRYTYDNAHRLTNIAEQAGSGGSITYSYDNNGNPLSKTNSTGEGPASTLFDYNARNQLVRLAAGELGSEAELGRYAYNYAGLRIQHLGSDRGDIRYVYDGDSILDEYSGGSVLAHYRYADRLLSLSQQGVDQYYHLSALGTTANLTNAAGESQVAYRTDAFGKITHQEGNSVNRRVFTGHEHDTETGLIYMKARFYDPDVGRFLNQDTYLGEATTPPSLHRYLYGFSNPTVWWDPTGNYNEAGHYYTTYYIAREVGYSHEESHELALFSQSPDERGDYDAIETKIDHLYSGGKDKDYIHVQEKGHALTGGLAEPLTNETAAKITAESDNAKAGVLIHLLADSFSHRKMDGNERTEKAKLYGDNHGFGHGLAGTDPDEIHRRPELYSDYTEKLAETLSDRRGLSGKDRENAINNARNATKEYLGDVVETAKKGAVIKSPNPRGRDGFSHSKASELTTKNSRGFTLKRYNLEENDLVEPEAHSLSHGKRVIERFKGELDSSNDITNLINKNPNLKNPEQFKDKFPTVEDRMKKATDDLYK